MLSDDFAPRRHLRHLRLSALAFVVYAAACGIDAVPMDCQVAADCQAGMTCDPASHRCTPGGPGLDATTVVDERVDLVLADAAAFPDLVPSPACRKDSDCAPSTPRCDPLSQTCVVCLPMNDNCPPGQHCVASDRSYACFQACQGDPDCRNDGGPVRACCGSGCIDTSVDTAHCGACGRACPRLPHTILGCVSGVCRVGACDPGWSACSGNAADGCSTNIDIDLKHCGGCGRVCGGPNVQHAKASCVMGICTIQCDPGFADCNSDTSDGCEANLMSDRAHCGGCKQPCAIVNHQLSDCRMGACLPGSCEPDWANCTGDLNMPCNTYLGDPTHCGACQTVCQAMLNAMPACLPSGNTFKCGPGACLAGWGDCDMNAANGCEKSVLADLNNCGTCANVCRQNGDVPACIMGKCGYTMCLPGSFDCNMDPTDGCEGNSMLDPKHCGGCGMACPALPNATPSCQAGKCVLACNSSFYDCDRNPQNGCELKEDLQHCGGCSYDCTPQGSHVSAACKFHSCEWTCDLGWTACDGRPDKGCNQDLSNDVANCGKCKVACSMPNATPACVKGMCAIQSCSAGFGDCDMNPANGCEVTLGSDIKNCGKCGNACPMNAPSCLMGACDARPRVLLLLSDDARVHADVQNGLLATGAFGAVDIFNVALGTPTLMQLQAYEAVLLWTFQGFADTQTTGDRLADYWDGGGRVVLALDGYALKGRFGTVANGYRLLQPPQAGVQGPMDSMAKPFEPLSPLVAGVTRIDGVVAWRAQIPGIVNGGIVVAEWGISHDPLIVRGVVKGRNRVDLNFYPVSDAGAMKKVSNSWTGDGFVLLKNALFYK